MVFGYSNHWQAITSLCLLVLNTKAIELRFPIHHSIISLKIWQKAAAEMDPPHPLKALLQLQLASDSVAVLHLSYVLSSLTPTCFSPSSHTQNWTTRINSLLHSKDPGARWAGLCIAHQTSIFSKPIMIESAQSWLGVALPMLSVCVFISLLKLFVSCNLLEKWTASDAEGINKTFESDIQRCNGCTRVPEATGDT